MHFRVSKPHLFVIFKCHKYKHTLLDIDCQTVCTEFVFKYTESDSRNVRIGHAEIQPMQKFSRIGV
jgi:hypothetical protein